VYDEYYELYYVILEEDRGREEIKFMKAQRSSFFALTDTGMLRALSSVQRSNSTVFYSSPPRSGIRLQFGRLLVRTSRPMPILGSDPGKALAPPHHARIDTPFWETPPKQNLSHKGMREQSTVELYSSTVLNATLAWKEGAYKMVKIDSSFLSSLPRFPLTAQAPPPLSTFETLSAKLPSTKLPLEFVFKHQDAPSCE
jgi:hypothetical protein